MSFSDSNAFLVYYFYFSQMIRIIMLILIYFQKRITRTQIHEFLNPFTSICFTWDIFLVVFCYKIAADHKKKTGFPGLFIFPQIVSHETFLTGFCLDLAGYMIKAEPFPVSLSVYKLFHVKHYNVKSGSLRIEDSSDCIGFSSSSTAVPLLFETW